MEELTGIIPGLMEVNKRVHELSLALKVRGQKPDEAGLLLASPSSSALSAVEWGSRSVPHIMAQFETVIKQWLSHLTVLLHRLLMLEAVAIYSLLPHQVRGDTGPMRESRRQESVC